MNIEQIMSSNLVTVRLDDSLKKVRHLFESTQFHHLLVIEDKKLLGVISDRDLLKAISPNIGNLSETEKDRASLNKRAHQIMSRNLTTLKSSADIYDAIGIFNSSKISCIPVVDEENRPIGILSWRDIMKKLEAMRR